ncbi:Essential protein Yae1, N terminal [Cytospora paraplurivora]|uniref:Protein YAE1 n=1 Tax=Cytospora paraplurivora TaxID=2898453 RepID=A0AAN9U543_9PEZI
MLLRQSDPADADHYISAVAMGSPGAIQDATNATAIPRADLLDDVFGSDGEDHDSPAFLEGGEVDHHHHHDDHDDDDHESQIRSMRGHPSDVHRLRQEHKTAGYREGITVAKATSIQAGFDEGFGLGATIGLRAGYLLGVLEGVAAATATLAVPLPGRSSRAGSGAGAAPDREKAARGGADGPAAAAAKQLLSDAKAELDLKSVFSPEYWSPDGTWRYEVVGGDGDEVLFSHVAEAHPLVRKWVSVVEGAMRRWGLEEQLPLLQRRDEEEGGEEGEAVARVPKPVVAVAQGQADAKAPSGHNPASHHYQSPFQTVDLKGDAPSSTPISISISISHFFPSRLTITIPFRELQVHHPPSATRDLLILAYLVALLGLVLLLRGAARARRPALLQRGRSHVGRESQEDDEKVVGERQ